MSAQPDFSDEVGFRDGWMWPARDDVAYDHIKMYAPLLRLAARQARGNAVAVQAGGNAGMYPAILADHFDKVITFEPEPLNHFCLVYNTSKFGSRVEAHQAVLGNRRVSVGLQERVGLRDGKRCVNTGAFHVEGEGSIPQKRIDDLNLEALDFLQLDIEGWELNALMGAEQTIKRFSPVIMVESFDHGDSPDAFLLERGYTRIVKGVHDSIYVRHDGADNVQ